MYAMNYAPLTGAPDACLSEDRGEPLSYIMSSLQDYTVCVAKVLCPCDMTQYKFIRKQKTWIYRHKKSVTLQPLSVCCPRKAAIKRERGESPRQSRCCEPPFCEGATLRPLATCRAQTLSASAEAGKAVASGRRVRRPAGMPHVLQSTRGLGKGGDNTA